MKQKYAIDTKEAVPINGTNLHIRIRSGNADNPVVLFLHGGPGVCDRHWVLKYQSGLADVCTMVCWDQRGSGKSYTSQQGKQTMTIDQVIEDARLLVEYLCQRFHQEKLILVGHSWGSFLGTVLMSRYPEHIAAYIGMGQLADRPDNERISYEFVYNEAQKRGDKKAIADLERIGAPQNGLYASLDDLVVQRDYMTKFGGGDHKESSSIWTSVIIPILLSPEYSLLDMPKYAKGAFYCLRQLWSDVATSSFRRDITSVKVPVYITQGRHDQDTPSELARDWFDALDAPHKEWFWFEESGHSPIKEESAAWNGVVRDIIAKTKIN